ncbi:arf-GAP with GTPase, ANK repeat and PH domain-containing protein 2-like isoform X5 [Lates japonicus]|uniref:Arf-GAP with GTPase, ANK repeat and PH domain-containing protein 2-like isoform X5 n=1 Tax=Lates japonicus TaxID=270547 RepID=A0AAD3R0M8_LATJO|nr:arf-GAP with GTPase, ANK repeat and PH domain-containing protein 2-like isoform X5 [Lates japonicus]
MTSNNSKSVNSIAIKAEIKRHESLQSTINRLSKQFERVADQQLRSGLKVYLHSIQGKLIFLWVLCDSVFLFVEFRERDDKLPLPVSVGVTSSSKSTLVFILISPPRGAEPPTAAAVAFYLSVGSLDNGATNGNIAQQPSPWQQDETCCAAYFLSANLQLPSKPLPFRQTGAFTCEVDQFYIISSQRCFPPFLMNVCWSADVGVVRMKEKRILCGGLDLEILGAIAIQNVPKEEEEEEEEGHGGDDCATGARKIVTP